MISVTSSIQWLGSQVQSFVDRTIDQKLNQAGALWLARSRALAPVRTGELRAGEDYQVANRTLILIMGPSHDVFAEFGTRRMRPQPHVRPALQEMKRVFGTDVELLFNSPASGGTWGGVFAHQGGFVLPSNLTHKERAHVAKHLLPISQKFHRGNVKRARMRVRRFGS